jgi:subtilisin family serine protease
MRKWIGLFLVFSLLMGSNLSKLSPDLREKLGTIGEEEFVKVFVFPKDQPEYSSLDDMFPLKSERVEYLRDFANRTQKPILEFINSLPKGEIREVSSFWVANVIRVEARKSIIFELTELEDVGYIEEVPKTRIYWDGRTKGGTGGGGSILTPEWNIEKIKADSVWQLGYMGDGIIIGSMDTGVDHDHPTFGNRWAGYWFDAVNGLPTPYDDNSHGTHTTGTAIGGDGPGPDVNDIGVAPHAQFVAAKVFDSNGNGVNIMAGFQWYATLVADSNVPVRVVNNSWGSDYTTSLAYWSAVLTWRSLGIIPVFSIGNNGPGSGTAGTPGNYPTVIGVGATNSSDNIASFSSRGPAPNQSPWNDPQYWCNPNWNFIKPDISAPGVSIRSSVPGGGYQGGWIWSGTSMAAPHITGVVALILSKNPTLEFCEVYNILIESADQPSQGGTYPNNNYGWGRVNALAAINATPISAAPYLVLVSIDIDAGGDEILDPGDTTYLTFTLTNIAESTAYSATAYLQVNSSYITLIDSTSDLGDIVQGDTVDNTVDPFVFEVSPSAPTGEEIEFNIHVVSNGGDYTKDFPFTLFIGVELADYLDVTAGNALLTVTDVGAVGFLGSDQMAGSGFIYPYPGVNTLFYGSFAVGNSESYVVDAWYESGGLDDRDWEPTTNPDGRLFYIPTPPRYADVAVLGRFTDSGHQSPQNIVAEQLAFAYEHPDYDDFVIVQYKISNDGASAVDNLYVAYFMDFDINPYDQNQASIDTSLHLSYMWYGNTYVGVNLLTTGVSNLSVIENEIYIYPSQGMPDSIQWKFMNGDYHFENSTAPGDWSIVTSAGPFSLNPGDTIEVAFAVVGGNSFTSLLQNAQRAKDVYEDSTLVGVKEISSIPGSFRILNILPNPFNDRVNITLSVEKRERVSVEVYDVTGRRIATIAQGIYDAGIHSFKWNGEDIKGSKVSQGVYFIKVEKGDEILTKPVIYLH